MKSSAIAGVPFLTWRLVAVFGVFLLSACPHSGAESPRGRLSCFVSIPPQAFLVERIGGPYVDVHVMLRPGQSPHTFEPTARLFSELSRSRVYFTIGIAFEEPLVERIKRRFEGVRIADTTAGIEKRVMADEHEDARGIESPSDLDSSGTAGDSSHGTLDPHVWLSPRLAVAVARNIHDTLVELDPEHSGTYARNFQDLQADMERLDEEITRMLAPYRGRAIFVFHPAYGYFADAYGLRQIAIEKHGRAPGPRHLAEVIEQAKAEGAGAIFVQPQVSATQARMVARAIGVKLVELDPLAGDYAANLRAMGQKVAEALEGSRQGGPSDR